MPELKTIPPSKRIKEICKMIRETRVVRVKSLLTHNDITWLAVQKSDLIAHIKRTRIIPGDVSYSSERSTLFLADFVREDDIQDEDEEE